MPTTEQRLFICTDSNISASHAAHLKFAFKEPQPQRSTHYFTHLICNISLPSIALQYRNGFYSSLHEPGQFDRITSDHRVKADRWNKRLEKWSNLSSPSELRWITWRGVCLSVCACLCLTLKCSVTLAYKMEQICSEIHLFQWNGSVDLHVWKQTSQKQTLTHWFTPANHLWGTESKMEKGFFQVISCSHTIHFYLKQDSVSGYSLTPFVCDTLNPEQESWNHQTDFSS